MLAWRFHETGPIENLQPEEIPLPEPGPGEALVRIHYAALNPADRYLVQGQYPRAGKPPFTPGRDACGIIERPADGGRFAQGDAVVLLGGDTGICAPVAFAQYAAIPEEWLAPLPEGWTETEGAAAPLVALTAWQGLVDRGRLQPGETVLITGASGGVGSAAVILAKSRGARVFALSRSAEKRRELEALGADATFDSEAPDLEKQVKAAAGERPVNLVLENLGGPYLQRALTMAGYGARIMVIGLLAGLESKVQLGLLIHKCLQIQGMSVSSYTAEAAQGAWEEVVASLKKGGVRWPIDRVYGAGQPLEAFRRLEAGPLGKVLADFRE
ncbi:MAG: zinc-binding alcohol dehydrogenase family protein [Candidatus Hydrogenedentes bacterium]|nr:zinc-binding alcohol dehydrogenase family protein [Candidatus Hydrogenedentota bacterium]